MFRGTCQHQLYNIPRETQKKNLQRFDKEISSKLLSCKCSTTNQLLSGSRHLLRRENDSILLICPGLRCFNLPCEDALWRIRLWKKNPLSKIQPSLHGWTSRSPIYPEQLGLVFIAHQIFHTPIKSSQNPTIREFLVWMAYSGHNESFPKTATKNHKPLIELQKKGLPVINMIKYGYKL